MTEDINKKSINNAVAAYLMLFISWLLLFNKNNKYINNEFVKSHIKTSIILHSLILLNYIVFISFGLFGRISIFGIGINIILADIVFIIIGILIIRGIYGAINSKKPNIGEAIKFTSTMGLDINNDNVVDEKDKLTIILSYIPFLGYIIGGKYSNEKIQNILRLNLIATLIIVIVYIFRHDNVSNLFLLLYIIFTTFSGVYLYGKNELITITLPEYFSPNGFLNILKASTLYFYFYFKGNFKEFNLVMNDLKEKQEKTKETELTELSNKENLKLDKKLIYLPIINLIFAFQSENKYSYHIRNGITISIIFILLLILVLFDFITSRTLLLILFPVCFGYGKLYTQYYKMPFIYDIYELFLKIKKIFKSSKKKIDEKRKEVNEVNLKVE